MINICKTINDKIVVDKILYYEKGIEKEINELIEAAYEMGRKASDLTRNEEKQHHEGNDLLKQKNTYSLNGVSV